MTREEAIEVIKQDIPCEHDADLIEALEMAIQALSQEPCTDAVSREAVLDIIRFEDKWLLDAKGHNADTEIAFSGMKARVDALSSVTPICEEREKGECPWYAG